MPWRGAPAARRQQRPVQRTGAEAGAAAAGFLWAARLAAWEAAKDTELGTRAPAAIAKTTGRMEKFLGCMAFRGITKIVADRASICDEARKRDRMGWI